MRKTVAEDPVSAQMGYEVNGASPANMLTLVTRFDLREALGFRYDPEEFDEMFGTAV